LRPGFIENNKIRSRAGLRAVAAAVVLLLAVMPGCSDDSGGSSTGPGANSVDNDLVFSYEEGTAIRMGEEYAICCGIWEPGFNESYVLKIFFYDRDELDSAWKIFFEVNQIAAGTIYSLSESGTPLRMFVINFGDNNELDSDLPQSTGTVTVESLSCGPPVEISFSVDASLASEISGMPPVKVSGQFSCSIFTNPSPLGCDFSI